MALLSMTGFGSGAAEAALDDGSTLAVAAEVRSVNHRHLQCKLRLPHEFAALEHALESRVRKRLGRGSVHASFDVERSGGAPSIDVDEDVVARYLALQSGLVERFGVAPIANTAELFALPGVLAHGGAERRTIQEDGPEARALHAALEAALDGLVEMRAQEGDATARDLRATAAEVVALVDRIEALAPGLVDKQRARLLERIAELSENPATSEADLAREIALLSDRLDVSEELSRLRSHIEQLDGMLGATGAIGRKLDFLAQEFFREANTIGSKCSDADVAHLVVDLKTHVERLREQVQNVE